MNHKLLEERAKVLHNIIAATHQHYFDENTNEGQRGLYETILGAAIWYLPGSDELFSGRISDSALESLRNDSENTKLVEEHSFPRKVGGKYLYELYLKNKDSFKEKDLVELYKSKLGRFNLVLKPENDRLKKHQKAKNFLKDQNEFLEAVSGIEKYAYSQANVTMKEFSVQKYQEFKKYKRQLKSKITKLDKSSLKFSI